MVFFLGLISANRDRIRIDQTGKNHFIRFTFHLKELGFH
ncbi:hypothetical protein DESC_30018 [Desulfosarcina cetonica]|nr:hypothetical protein DESC_30018 [Desulfosarcina cetonica]